MYIRDILMGWKKKREKYAAANIVIYFVEQARRIIIFQFVEEYYFHS